MRKYKATEVEIVKKEKCVELRCDICRKKASFPENDSCVAFSWGGTGVGGGTLLLAYSIDGEYEKKEYDLCYECAEKLEKQMKSVETPHCGLSCGYTS